MNTEELSDADLVERLREGTMSPLRRKYKLEDTEESKLWIDVRWQFSEVIECCDNFEVVTFLILPISSVAVSVDFWRVVINVLITVSDSGINITSRRTCPWKLFWECLLPRKHLNREQILFLFSDWNIPSSNGKVTNMTSTSWISTRYRQDTCSFSIKDPTLTRQIGTQLTMIPAIIHRTERWMLDAFLFPLLSLVDEFLSKVGCKVRIKDKDVGALGIMECICTLLADW